MSAGGGTTPVALLASRSALDWPTLRVGRRHGWVSDEEAVDAAVTALVDDPGEDRAAIIDLAGADGEPPEVIDELIDRIAGPVPSAAPLNTLALREAEAHGEEILDPPGEAPLLRRWLWARLAAMVSQHEPEAIRARADELWAELGYPEELRPMSAWSTPEPSIQHDPYATITEILRQLEAELGDPGSIR